MARRIVYLDHSVLSQLAKDPSSGLLKNLKALVDADKALFPYSWTHHTEAQLDSRLEDAIHRVGAMLSRGIRFHTHSQIAALQAHSAYLNFVGQYRNTSRWGEAYEHDPRGEIRKRWLEGMLGGRVTTSAEGRHQRRAIKELYAESLNAQKNAVSPAASYEAAKQRYTQEAVRFYFVDPHRRALTGQLGELDIPMLQFSGLVADAAYGIRIPPRTQAEVLAGYNSMFEFFASGDCRGIPFIELEASILASLEVDERSRHYSPSDLYDLQTWSAYLPYVDMAVADRHMHQVLSRRGLAANYGCSVYPNTKSGVQDMCVKLAGAS